MSWWVILLNIDILIIFQTTDFYIDLFVLTFYTPLWHPNASSIFIKLSYLSNNFSVDALFWRPKWISKVSGYLLVNFLIMKYWFLEIGHQVAQNCCPHLGGNEQVTPMITAWRECADHRAGRGVQADPGQVPWVYESELAVWSGARRIHRAEYWNRELCREWALIMHSNLDDVESMSHQLNEISTSV